MKSSLRSSAPLCLSDPCHKLRKREGQAVHAALSRFPPDTRLPEATRSFFVHPSVHAGSASRCPFPPASLPKPGVSPPLPEPPHSVPHRPLHPESRSALRHRPRSFGQTAFVVEHFFRTALVKDRQAGAFMADF